MMWGMSAKTSSKQQSLEDKSRVQYICPASFAHQMSDPTYEFLPHSLVLNA